MSKWIDISIENPFRTWWRARKYFKRPKITVRPFYSSYRAWKRGGRILEIECWDLVWKDKFNSPRHEINPHVSILLFGKIGFRIDFNVYYIDEFGEKQDGDMIYWEYLLNYLAYDKSLLGYSAWTKDSDIYEHTVQWGNKEDGTEDIIKPMPYTLPCVAMSLNKEGIKQLKKELNEKRGNPRDYQIFSQEPGLLWSFV